MPLPIVIFFIKLKNYFIGFLYFILANFKTAILWLVSKNALESFFGLFFLLTILGGIIAFIIYLRLIIKNKRR